MRETFRFVGRALDEPSPFDQGVRERSKMRATLLVDRMANGDRGALGELYDRYGWLVRGIVQGALPDAEGVDEIVQAVFVQAWREAELYDAQAAAPMAWLCAMARERALGRLKRRWRTLGPTTPAAGGPLAAHALELTPGRSRCRRPAHEALRGE